MCVRGGGGGGWGVAAKRVEKELFSEIPGFPGLRNEGSKFCDGVGGKGHLSLVFSAVSGRRWHGECRRGNEGS